LRASMSGLGPRLRGAKLQDPGGIVHGREKESYRLQAPPLL
jgi:hypothetical protein